MSLEQKISADIATAMKAKDAPRLSTLRMLKAALMNKGVEKNRALDGAEELQVVSSLVKQRRDSIEQFTAGGRTDLAEKERSRDRDPRDLSAAGGERRGPRARRRRGDRRDRGAASAKDMGKVMKAVDGAAGGQDRRRQARERAGARPAVLTLVTEPVPCCGFLTSPESNISPGLTVYTF